MRFKVGIAYHRLAENFKFIKGLLHNLHLHLCFSIFVWPGLYFNVINLKILQMVNLVEGYNLCKF